MLKFLLTAIFLGLLACLLYHPLSLPDDDSMINKYRPSFNTQTMPNNTGHSLEKNLKLAIPDFKRDSITSKGSQILVDSTP